jgi:Holliday junction DNA helicase RuvA
MIGRLRGTIVGRRAEVVTLDVEGVGYEITMTPQTLSEIPGLGEPLVLHTHLHVREDAMTLYGFMEESAREMFRLLLATSGIGPKVAMAILGSMRPDELSRAVTAEDVDALTIVPGIGKRSAQRILLELKPKLVDADVTSIGGNSDSGRIREALEGLGYGAAEIRDVMPEIPADGTLQEQLRVALKALGRST